MAKWDTYSYNFLDYKKLSSGIVSADISSSRLGVNYGNRIEEYYLSSFSSSFNYSTTMYLNDICYSKYSPSSYLYAVGSNIRYRYLIGSNSPYSYSLPYNLKTVECNEYSEQTLSVASSFDVIEYSNSQGYDSSKFSGSNTFYVAKYSSDNLYVLSDSFGSSINVWSNGDLSESIDGWSCDIADMDDSLMSLNVVDKCGNIVIFQSASIFVLAWWFILIIVLSSLLFCTCVICLIVFLCKKMKQSNYQQAQAGGYVNTGYVVQTGSAQPNQNQWGNQQYGNQQNQYGNQQNQYGNQYANQYGNQGSNQQF